MNLIVAFACLFFIVTQNVNTQEISEDITTTVLSGATDIESSPQTIVNTQNEQTTDNPQRSFESLLAQKILEHASKNDWTGKVHLTVATKPTSKSDEINTPKLKATPLINQQFVDQFSKIFSQQYRNKIRSNNKQKLRPYLNTLENQLYEEQIRTNNVNSIATDYNLPLFRQQQPRKSQEYYYPTLNEQQLPKIQESYYNRPSDLSSSQQLYYYYPIADQVSTPKQVYYKYPTAEQPSLTQQLYYNLYPTADQVNRVSRMDQTPSSQQLYNYYPQQSSLQQLYNYYPQQSSLQQLYYYPQQQMYYYYPQTTQQQLYYYYPQTNYQQLYSNLNQPQSYAPNYLGSNQMYYYIMPETQPINNNNYQMNNPVQNMKKDDLVYYYPTNKVVNFVNSDSNNLYDESIMMEKTNKFDEQQEIQQLNQQTYINNMQKLNQQQPQTSASNQLYYYYLI